MSPWTLEQTEKPQPLSGEAQSVSPSCPAHETRYDLGLGCPLFSLESFFIVFSLESRLCEMSMRTYFDIFEYLPTENGRGALP